jgi:ABC-type transporter Mla subunit MlaD
MNWVFINKVTESLLAMQNLDKKSCLGKHCSNWKADICGTDKCGVESLRDGRPRTNYNQEYPDAPSTLMQVDTTYITDPKGNVLGHVEVVTNIETTRRLDETLSNVAATLEETSSALEQMSGLTKQNAKASGEANQMMKEADQTVSQANSAMDGLTNSMSGLSEASQETGKIIKTIDEIAFQTNLLALNAAVEAARAGEAGAGFAVVADEVRNLAMRAAEAAKNTASLIEDTIRRIDEGSSLVEQTNRTFGGMVESINKVAQMLESITNASQEQSLGIEEINRAVANLENFITGSGSQDAIDKKEKRHAEGETRLLESGF